MNFVRIENSKKQCDHDPETEQLEQITSYINGFNGRLDMANTNLVNCTTDAKKTSKLKQRQKNKNTRKNKGDTCDTFRMS